MKKRVLFINVRSHMVERMEPLFAAKNLNVDPVLLCDKDPEIDDRYVNPDNVFIADTYDMDKALEIVKEIHQKNPVSGVLTWADKDVELVSRIAAALGLPGPSIEASKNARNKYLMRSAIALKHPELCPRFKSVRSLEELQTAVDEIGVPGVLKPVGASGSKSIIKIFDNHDLYSAYHEVVKETRIDRDPVYNYFPDQYIYEELMDGDEISIEGFVSTFDNNIIIAGMTDKFVTDKYSTEYKEFEPSQKNPEYLRVYREQITKAIRALGISQCSFHAECKVNGPQLKVIEIAARPGGEFITTHLVPLASGISFVEQNIKNALGLPIDTQIEFAQWSQSPKCIAGHLDFMSNQEGIVTHIGGLQRIYEDPNVVNFLPLKEEGDSIVLPPDDFSSLYTATMVVKGTSIEDIEKSFDLIQPRFEISISKEAIK